MQKLSSVLTDRSLDLTGPLLLGGVPKLPEDFPVRSQQYVGCMKNLRIDNQHVDMASFIANNGTLPGTQCFRTPLFMHNASSVKKVLTVRAADREERKELWVK